MADLPRLDPLPAERWDDAARDALSPFRASVDAGTFDALRLITSELVTNAIRHGSTPRSSAEFGAEIVRMLEAVDRSLERGGAATALEEPTYI